MSSFFNCHSHSKFSTLDGMPGIEQMVATVVSHDQPALALTDHGNMAGSLRLYKECMKAGIAPFPGIEAYVVNTLEKEEERYHCGILALDYEGYKALCALSSMSFDSAHFHYKPRITFKELMKFGKDHGKHVAVTTGCYFGLVIQSLIRQGEQAATAILQNMQKNLPNLYVEVQHHNTIHDDGSTDWELATTLADLAYYMGLPLIIGQDAHYCRIGDKKTHEMMKKLGYKGTDDSEFIFPGDSYHLASTAWAKKHYAGLKKIWDEAELSFDDLLSKNILKMPSMDRFEFHVPPMYTDPQERLKRMVKDGMYMHDLEVFDSYTSRTQYELDIIKEMKFADYFLLIGEAVQWARKQGIQINARGSANGSLVCYVLGITEVDPIKWGISFDRFLHPSRKKPPDVDLDIDRDRRQEFIDYLGGRFTVTPIGTFGRLTDKDDRGAVFVKYLAMKKRSMPESEFNRTFGGVEKLRELESIVPKDTAVLRKLADMDVYNSAGTHAAGLVLSSPEHPLEDYIPTMKVGGKNGNTVTQVTMDDVEEAGYVKMDNLGLAALTTVNRILQRIGKDPSKGLIWIPDDDKEACKLLREGRTGTGIFQFEGYSTAKGGREMGVKSTQDAIYCLALYRPASMDTGSTDEYIARRKKLKPVEHLHPIFEKATKDTYGVFVLQDQVIDVFRLLGMEYDDLNDMLKAVKQSNHNVAAAQKTFARIRPIFLKLCLNVGMTPDQAKKAWATVLGFSDYGFNKAHATSYGLLAYRMAYLKAKNPLEFMCSLLETWAGESKEKQYLAEARRIGIKIGRANINKSEANWTVDGAMLRRGLLSIPKLGDRSAAELALHKPYKNVQDIIDKCNGGPGYVTGGKSYAKTGELNGVLGALKDAGVLEQLEEGE